MKYFLYCIVLLSFICQSLNGQDDGSAGFDNGFYIQSDDGSFVFRPFGLIHTDLRILSNSMQINSDETQASTFLVRRLRFGFEGTLYNKIDYDLETNIGNAGAEIIFAWINLGYLPEAQIRIGQFKEPFNYEVLLPEKYLDFIERSMAAVVISPAEDIGVMIHNFGSPCENFFEYGIGVFNGLGGSALKNDPEKTFEYTGRIAVYPFVLSSNILNKIRIAGSVLYEDNKPEAVELHQRTPLGFEFFPEIMTEGKRFSFGSDIQWICGPFSLKAAYIQDQGGRNISQISNVDVVTEGWHIDATYLITGEDKVLKMKSGLEVAGRFEKLNVDAGAPFTIVGYTDVQGNPITLQKNDVTTVTMGLNYYLNYNIKFQMNYQVNWFGNDLLTPSSRTGDILKTADDLHGIFLARVQLFF
ncbi:MAG: hypothetical protein A2057_14770 [Ignavibacteria bacterium GWA2_35_9]|nr:MAG: hypothetical protein A2057_14770 [Ignavibacteria bacterium GWA2_35_9]OGU48057.1 MAG: hypothetical protein A2080_07640 [Ignavibacteria bacterium GWC2_36_12]